MEEQINSDSDYADEILLKVIRNMIINVMEEEGAQILPPVHHSTVTIDEGKTPIYNLDGGYQIREWKYGKLTKEDLRAIYFRNLALINEYQTDNVSSIVVCTEEVEKDITYKAEQCCFKPDIISLKDFNADELLDDIKIKIRNNEELTIEDKFNLGHSAYFKSERNPKEILYEVSSLANQIKTIEQDELDMIKIEQLRSLYYTITDKEEQEKYFEEIKRNSERMTTLIENEMNKD